MADSMVRTNLRRLPALLIGGLLVSLIGVGVWLSLRPHWKTFVSPPLLDGSRLTFRYPEDWSIEQNGAGEDEGQFRMHELIFAPVPPSGLIQWFRARWVPPAKRPPRITIVYFADGPDKHPEYTIAKVEEDIYRLREHLMQRGMWKSSPVPKVSRHRYPFAEAVNAELWPSTVTKPGRRILHFCPAPSLVITDLSVTSTACSPDWQRTGDAAETIAQSLRLQK